MTQDTFTPQEEQQRAIRSRKLITYLILFAIVMFFAGLTSAYVVSMSGGYWTRITLPSAFLYSTVFIVLGSVTVHLGLMAGRKGDNKGAALWVALTLVLGLGFTWSQFEGWKDLVSKAISWSPNRMSKLTGTYGTDYVFQKDGVDLVLENGNYYLPTDVDGLRPLNAELDEQKDRTGPYLYALTVLHMAHLAFGLLSLLVMLGMALRARYTKEDHVGLWAGAMYWHFLGGLWVYLLLFLLFVH
ncbi:MAG: heme-copper oxidase subunit III [Flavobacteriales bacterium]|nr:heme-copper oxidase subunit III [Flavobacteriales bacterium]